MPNWFYYDELGTRTGPVPSEDLKFLADTGAITPETIIEADSGKQVLAKNVRGLFQVSEPATRWIETPLPPPPPAPDFSMPPPLFATHPRVSVSEPLVNSLPRSGSVKTTVSAENAVSTRWFYYDAADQKVGPVDFSTLKTFAKVGIIQPETVVESETGTPRMKASYFTGEDGLFPDKSPQENLRNEAPKQSSPPPFLTKEKSNDLSANILLWTGWIFLTLLPLGILKIIVVDVPHGGVILILAATFLGGGVAIFSCLKPKQAAAIAYAIGSHSSTILRPKTNAGKIKFGSFGYVCLIAFVIITETWGLGRSPTANNPSPSSPPYASAGSLENKVVSPPASSEEDYVYTPPTRRRLREREEDGYVYTPPARSYTPSSSYSSSMTQSRAIEIAKKTILKGVAYPSRATFLSADVGKSSDPRKSVQHWGVNGLIRAFEGDDYITLPYSVVMEENGKVVHASVYKHTFPANMLN